MPRPLPASGCAADGKAPRPGQVEEETKIPFISQRLFYRFEELLDADRSVSDLGLMDGDTLEVFEVQIDDDDLDKLEDVRPRGSKKRSREEGFGGTGLLGFGIEDDDGDAVAQTDSAEGAPAGVNDSTTSSAASSSSGKKRKMSSPPPRVEQEDDISMEDDRISCPTCTFLNHAALDDCEVCGNPMAE